MIEPLLSVRDLTVEFHGPRGVVRAVDGVSFDIGPGEVLGLAGESGSGKSTIAQAILRILRPPAVITGGEVWLGGRDLLSLGAEELRALRWREVSLVFQSAMNALNPVLTVGEQLRDVLSAHDREHGAAAQRRVEELLALVGIDPARHKSYPHELSGGMRQRVVIALALALSAPLVLMDEPTTALDVVVQREILQKIGELRERLGFAVLFITHDLSLMLEFSTRLAILYAGRLVETAPAAELSSSPRHPYTQGLLASFPALRGARRRMVGIPGAPPDLARPPPGCRFHPRCARAEARCASDRPPLLSLGAQRAVACHLEVP